VVLLVIAALYLGLGVFSYWIRTRRAEERQAFSLLRVLRHMTLWPIDLIVEWRRLRRRTETVRLAAAEASEMDPRFAPEVVAADADELFCAIQAAWTRDDRTRLAELVASDLMKEWERRLTAFAVRGWEDKIEIKGPVHVDYVGLRNTEDDRSKRAVVRITATVRDVVVDRHGNTVHRVNSVSDTHHICEYWTLEPSGDRWILNSVEQHHEGLHQLTEPVLPSPWADTTALERDATLEQAASARIENSQVRQIAGAALSSDARTAALDISLVDDRFAPRVLETEVDHAVRTWAEAIDGDDAPLEAMATASAVRQLLYPGDSSNNERLVVRGPRVRSVEIIELDGQAQPPSMLVELRVSGRRYVEDRTTTTVLSGDKSVETSFRLRWRMELTDDAAHPWRIVELGSATVAPNQQDPEPATPG
jgi:predicted lipid-binding transport protein (Tim44 family)